MKRLVLLIALMATSACGTATETSGSPHDVRSTIDITSENVCVPQGVFVLIRQRGHYAAVRFVAVRRFDTEGTGEADYEAYVSNDGGRFSRENSRRHVGRASVRGWAGFHPFVFQRGNAKVVAGPIAVEYNFPSCVWFRPPGRSSGDHGIEIAPTLWTNIADVDAHGTDHVWYRHDPSGNRHIAINDGQ